MTKMDYFNNWVKSAGLLELDIGFIFYTWIGDWDRHSKSKLDMIFISTEWHGKFSNLEAKSLPRILSDHIPILVTSTKQDKEGSSYMNEFGKDM